MEKECLEMVETTKNFMQAVERRG